MDDEMMRPSAIRAGKSEAVRQWLAGNSAGKTMLQDMVPDDETIRMALINRLTNWQRNQWARAGYPLEVQPFLDMTKENR